MQNTNKQTIILLAIIAFLVAYIAFGSGKSASVLERSYGGDVIAKVNGKKIHEEEFRERLDFITGGRGASINMGNIDEKGLEALAKEVYVQRKVLEEAMDKGIQNEAELKNKVASLVNTIYKEKFLEDIAKKDINEEKIKTTYDELVAKAKVSKQYKVKHILFKDEAAAKAAKAKIEAGNASFEDVARLDSIDKPSAAKGGDLGYVFPDEFVKPFAEAVKGATAGKLTGPVQSEFGFHILVVSDSKPAEIVPFTDAKPRIEKQLGADAVRKYVEKLSEDLDIEIVKKPESTATEAPAAEAAATEEAK